MYMYVCMYMCVYVHARVYTDKPDCQDLFNLLLSVRLCGDDQQPVQQVNRDTMGTHIVGAADPRGVRGQLYHKVTQQTGRLLCDASVGSHDEDGGHVTLQRTVEEGKTFNVQHVDLVNEKDTGNNLGLPLLPPLYHLGIDLLTNFVLYLTSITCEGGRELLVSRGRGVWNSTHQKRVRGTPEFYC